MIDDIKEILSEDSTIIYGLREQMQLLTVHYYVT
jgi:hypothetical protein